MSTRTDSTPTRRLAPVMIALACLAPSVALAQSEADHAECATLLGSPPLDDILTRNDGHDFGELDARRQGASLLGLECSLDDLNRYFESAEWEYVETRTFEPRGPAGREISYYSDRAVIYCQKNRRSINLYILRCTKSAVFSFFEGNVSFVNVGASK